MGSTSSYFRRPVVKRFRFSKTSANRKVGVTTVESRSFKRPLKKRPMRQSIKLRKRDF